jgi:hypothetical protein
MGTFLANAPGCGPELSRVPLKENRERYRNGQSHWSRRTCTVLMVFSCLLTFGSGAEGSAARLDTQVRLLNSLSFDRLQTDRSLYDVNSLIDNAVSRVRLGIELETLRHYEDALQAYRRAGDLVDTLYQAVPIDQVPKQAFLISGLAHFDAARVLIRLGCRHMECMHHLAHALFALDRFVRLEAGVSRTRGFPMPSTLLSEIYCVIGDMQSLLGRPGLATAAYAAALRVNPLHLRARQLLLSLEALDPGRGFRLGLRGAFAHSGFSWGTGE